MTFRYRLPAFIVSGAALLLATVSPSQGAPAESPAQVVPKSDQDARATDLREGDRPTRERMEKCAYLGVATSSAPGVLRRQLGLPPGVGLVVEFIAAGSPAEEAGLRQFDVIEKLDDQILVNAEQLAVLVRSHQPGNELKLWVVRDGKPLSVSAKLIEKSLPPLEEMRMGRDDPNPFLQPPERGMILRPGRLPPGWMNESMQIQCDDGHISVLLSGKANHHALSIRDKAGNVIFDGPIDTPNQRAAVPEDLRKKLEHLPAPFDTLLARPPQTQPGDENSDKKGDGGGS